VLGGGIDGMLAEYFVLEEDGVVKIPEHLSLEEGAILLENTLGFLGFCAAVIAIASTGAIFRPGDWYKELEKPSWCPPNWLFGPTWTALYLTIAVAGWLVWRDFGFGKASGAFTLYFMQLLLNMLWSPLFFGLKRPGIAMAELVVLWVSIAMTIAAFWSLVQPAALLLLPYLVAGALNFAFWRLNAKPVKS
jgi:benzodiazapine receptor